MKKLIVYTNVILMGLLALSTALSLVFYILLDSFWQNQIAAAYTIQPIVSLALMAIAYLNMAWLFRRMNITALESETEDGAGVLDRVSRLPLVIASLIMIYSIIRAFIVTIVLFLIAGLTGKQFIAVWLIVIVTSLTISFIAYGAMILAVGHILRGKRPLNRIGSLPTSTFLFNAASILVPNIAIIAAIHLYDISMPDLRIDLGLFIVVAVIFSGIFILILLIKTSMANAEPPEVVIRDISDTFIDTYRITDREKEIIMMLLNGLSNREIADSMDCSEKTIKNHLYNIYKKAGVSSRGKLLKLING